MNRIQRHTGEIAVAVSVIGEFCKAYSAGDASKIELVYTTGTFIEAGLKQSKLDDSAVKVSLEMSIYATSWDKAHANSESFMKG